jgi:plastocyanin
MAMNSKPRQLWLWAAIALAATLFVLALVGLHGEVAAAGGTAQASKAKAVTIRDFAFAPATLKVARGSRVVFTNTGSVAHTVTRKSFNSGEIQPGTSFGVRFNQKGSFAYHCTIHPFMKGKIVVE